MLHLGGTVMAHPTLAPLLEDPDTLTPHPDNPKCGDTDAIAESIETNGLYRPLYAQTSTGHILAGNHAYHAALELGATTLPVIWLDVDDTTARRILLADNRTADLGRYDDALLIDLLLAIDQTDHLTGTGYTHDDLGLLLALQAQTADTPIGHGITADLIISGLTPQQIHDFRTLPGEDDRERFLGLLHGKVQ